MRSCCGRLPTCPRALRLLDGRGLALAVVSNGDCSLGESLETAGLRFDVVLDSATTDRQNPTQPSSDRRSTGLASLPGALCTSVTTRSTIWREHVQPASTPF